MAPPKKPQTEQELQDFIDSDRPARAQRFAKWALEVVAYAQELSAAAALAPDKFEFAVDYAKKEISELLEGPKLTDDFSDDELERMGMIGFSRRNQFQSDFLEGMVCNVENDGQVRKMLELATARALEENLELPSSVKEWLLRHLRNELPAAKPNQGRPPNHKFQHRISQIVQDIIEYIGLVPTRDDEIETGKRKNAVDAVVVALRDLQDQSHARQDKFLQHLPTRYDRIRKLWLEHRDVRISAVQLKKDFPDLG